MSKKTYILTLLTCLATIGSATVFAGCPCKNKDKTKPVPSVTACKDCGLVACDCDLEGTKKKKHV